MTVQELRDLLKDFDSGAEVGFTYNYGDYWKTQVVAQIHRVGEETVKDSMYDGLLMIADIDPDDMDEDEVESDCRRTRVVIS